jgi:hypothetical protein
MRILPSSARTPAAMRLLMATLLKTRQDLGCFAAPDEVHADTVAHLALQLGLLVPLMEPEEARRTKSLYLIPVETPVTERPPDRTVRAAFPHKMWHVTFYGSCQLLVIGFW